MNGKDKCELLKAIRRQIAEQYGLEYHPTECHHKGECIGTCPRCDAELKDLQRQLEKKGIRDIDLNESMREQVDKFTQTSGHDEEDVRILQDDVVAPEEPLRLQGMPAPTEDWLPTDIPPVRTEKKKIIFKECPIAGWNFRNPEDFWDELYEGAELVLIREKKNKHDRNAIAVALADDYDGNPDDFEFDFIIGYVPRTENELIANMMDLGWSDAFTAELTTVEDHGAYTDRLRMTIYIQSKEAEQEEEDHGQHVYAQMMDDDFFENFTDTLYCQGYVYFRWGGFPPWERDLPNEGEKVIFIHQDKDSTTLYLMHLVAKGDKSAPYLRNAEEELNMVDDCCPYVLTNVKGPVVCTSKDLSWLSEEKLCSYQPEGRLSDYAVDRLKEIFGETG